MRNFILAACAAATLGACNIDYNKTASGLVYKIYPGKGGDTLSAGKFIKYHCDFVLTGRPGKKDSVLNPPAVMPSYLQVDTSKRYEYTFIEILPKMRVGDSAVVVLSTDSLKNKRAIDPNDTIVFVKGSSIQCRLKVIQAFKVEKDVMADYQKEEDVEKGRETKSLEAYMSQKGIKSEKTKSGAYVSIENPGDQTMKADSGKVAVIKYKGYLQTTGDVFDTNMDSTKGHTDPIRVSVGSHTTIPAWEEALPYFGKGGSGKILVPAFLGYGPEGRPPVIPPYSNLVFDIQVLDVTNAPAQPKSADKSLPPGE